MMPLRKIGLVRERILKILCVWCTLNKGFGLEDAAEEMKQMQKLEDARKEMYGETKEKPMKQNMFRVV